MIDLFNIKKYNEYDFIQSTAPIVSGTWLCSETAGSYVRGYSYQVTIGTPMTVTRIEAQEDLKIQSAIYPAIETICNWLNNFFFAKVDVTCLSDCEPQYRGIYTSGNYTFNDSVISPVSSGIFEIDDLIQVKCAKRNNFISYITAINDDEITVNNEALRNTTENAVIMLMSIPATVEQAMCKIIHYDTFTRGAASDLKSENIGNYSYTKEDVQIGSLAYPQELTSILMPFKMVRFVQ